MRSLLGVRAAALGVSLLVFACKSKEVEKAPSAPPPAAAAPAAGVGAARVAESGQKTVLAELPAEGNAEGSAPGTGAHPAAPAEGTEFLFGERGGVAWVAPEGTGFRVAHDGRAGAPYPAVGEVVLSPDGRRCAYGALVDGQWHMVVDEKQGPGFTEVAAQVFSPDGAHLAYEAKEKESWHLVVDGVVSAGTRTRYFMRGFSADSSKIAFVDEADDQGQGRLVVSDLSFKHRTVVSPRVASVLVSPDKARLAAVSVSGETQRVVVIGFDRPDRVARGPKYDGLYGLSFGPGGTALAYLAERAGRTYVALDGKEEPLPPGDLVGGAHGGTLAFRGDGKGVGVLMASNGSTLLHEFFVQRRDAEAAYEEAEGLAYGSEAGLHAYTARRGASWFVVASGTEGPAFDRVVSPQFSPDGKYLVYRARQDGKRFVVVADPAGKTIRQLPAYEQVFPVHFTPDGRSIAYGVKDGRKLAWIVEQL
jgi:roadblock/LC7 domain-containing protein